MNLKATVAALTVVACGLGYSQFAAAQACSTPDGTLTGANTQIDANNCTHNTSFAKICANSETLGGGGMDVIQLDLGAGHTGVSLTLSSAAFTPELGVIATTCSSSTTCIIDETRADPGSIGPFSLADNLAAGSYYIFVANVTDAACGAYTLSVAGTLPVKLENFSVD
jgi:hypothetical protein